MGIETPLLADWELKNIGDQHPGLQPLMDNLAVKELLRVPMYLSHATTVDWSLQAGARTVGIQEFKKQLWRNIVRKDTDRRDGINLRREACFTQVAVQRAKAMRPFIPTDSFDAAALNALESDSVVIRTEDGIAPAHDLFEDWAIERYIEATYSSYSRDHASFLSTIGTEPAMRRGFRSWLTNKLESDNGAVSEFIACISDDDSILPFWRDEVLVAILLSPQANKFFANQQDALLDNELALMMRVVHLLRTACKEPDMQKLSQLPVNAKGVDFFSSMFLRPAGSGWEVAIAFLERSIRFIKPAHSPTILGLLQDWISSLKTPMPFDTWQDAVQWARDTYDKLQCENNDESRLWISGPIHIVALSVRDHLEQLTPDDLNWCAERALEKIVNRMTDHSHLAGMRNSRFDGTAACANILPVLLGHASVNVTEEDIKTAIACSLTYLDHDVQSYAIQGVHRYLWTKDTAFARSCLAGMIE